MEKAKQEENLDDIMKRLEMEGNGSETLGNENKRSKIIEKIKQIPIAWVWLIVVIVAIITLFYWFGIRPAQIKEKCYHSWATGQLDPITGNGVIYDDCLMQNGL